MAAKISSIAPYETWLLARVASGYPLETYQARKADERIAKFASYLTSINVKDRQLMLNTHCEPQLVRQILAVDTEAPAPPAADRLWEIIPSRELANLPPLSWLIPMEIPARGLTVIFGESGAGKSFVSLDYALRVAQDHPVIYIPTEGQAGYHKRVAAWCRHHRKSDDNLFFLFGAISLLERDTVQLLIDDLAALKPKMVVVDTLAVAMAGGDENSTRDMSLVTKACRMISTRTDSSVVLVHHIGRAGAHERGSTALRGNADTMIRVNPADDLIAIECSKTKDEHPFETRYVKLIPVTTDAGTSLVPVPAQIVIRQKSDPLTPNQHKILEYLSLEANREGASIREIGDATGISFGTTVRTLSNLLKHGFVNKPYGSYAITDEGRAKIGIETSSEADPAQLELDVQANGKQPSHYDYERGKADGRGRAHR